MDHSVQGLDDVTMKVFDHMSCKFAISFFIFWDVIDFIFLKVFVQDY